MKGRLERNEIRKTEKKRGEDREGMRDKEEMGKEEGKGLMQGRKRKREKGIGKK